MRMITGLNRIVIYTLLSQDCQLLTLQTITETVHGGYATVLTCVLKSVEIGYTLPKRLTSHLGMSNLRIYASGLNLFAWNRFKLWDVEQGNDGMQYPIQAVYNFGINLSF